MELFWLGLVVFCLWMFLDCVTHDVKDKIFWAILILCTGPIGSVLYASKRSKLLGETVRVSTNPDGTIAVPTNVPASTSSQIIRGIGVTIGVVLGVGGLLFVGFIILMMMAFSSYGSSK